MVSIVDFGFLTHFATRKRRYTAHASYTPNLKFHWALDLYPSLVILRRSSFVFPDSCWQRAGRGDLDLKG
jgi:hypothetical protein